jgi:hypothetical protein
VRTLEELARFLDWVRFGDRVLLGVKGGQNLLDGAVLLDE